MTSDDLSVCMYFFFAVIKLLGATELNNAFGSPCFTQERPVFRPFNVALFQSYRFVLLGIFVYKVNIYLVRGQNLGNAILFHRLPVR